MELNITAFLNLMVILVPFLLITAVFSRITVLELNLPALDAAAGEQEEIDLQLQLIVRDDYLSLQDAHLGVIRQIDAKPEGQDWQLLREVLLEVKQRFPEETDIALLLESSVSYKTMIEVMDRVKMTDVVNAGTLDTVELFPNVSIGDAPAAAATSEAVEPKGAANG